MANFIVDCQTYFLLGKHHCILFFSSFTGLGQIGSRNQNDLKTGPEKSHSGSTTLFVLSLPSQFLSIKNPLAILSVLSSTFLSYLAWYYQLYLLGCTKKHSNICAGSLFMYWICFSVGPDQLADGQWAGCRATHSGHRDARPQQIHPSRHNLQTSVRVENSFQKFLARSFKKSRTLVKKKLWLHY